jgi:FKBP-type peptidyl-prolyl cis-trans isomerase
MKNKYLFLLAILLVFSNLWSCKNSKSGSLSGEENFDRDASYALGMNVGTDIKQSLEMEGILFNFDEFMKGFNDSLKGENTRFTAEEAIELIESAYNTLTEGKNAEAIQKQTAFLAENSKKPGVVITPSGLQYEIITETQGPKPLASSLVKVHYEGRFIDGTVFDSSYKRGEPVEFPLDAVISGWTEGLQLMSAGSKYILYIPSELGYGPSGWGAIPGYSLLIFTVELLDILD